MRFEKPHSLSYQERTLHEVAVHDRGRAARRRSTSSGVPMKSLETSGSSLYSRMPLSGPSAAAFIAALTVLLGRRLLELDRQVDERDVRRRHADGHAVELAVRAPAARGRAPCAAPVVVGIIDSAAARARRRSSCGRSRMRWSFV